VQLLDQMAAQTQHVKATQGKELPPWLASVPRPLMARGPRKEEIEETKAAEPVPEPTCKVLEQQAESSAATKPVPEWLKQVPRPLLERRFHQEVQPTQASEPASESTESTNLSTIEPTLPPVVSVKKSKKGCAVVILRDQSIIERCVLQRVAVVDGVCVEMNRHTKKSKSYEEGVEEPAGIFVAWGIKVEKKVPVSHEGLEEFFNSLANKPCPEGLVATPPFQEGHVAFPLTSKAFLPLSWSISPAEANQKEIFSGEYCEEDTIKALCAAKGRLDQLWDRPPPPMARSLMTRVARSQLFPCSGNGGKEHENRAGDKLAEISEMTDLLDGIPAGAAFLDLCGGPGAWSQHLLEKTDLALRGYGFTLKADSGSSDDWKAEAKDEWYDDLYKHPNWKALWGADGTGDLLKLGNLEHCVNQLSREHVLLVVADGGFSDHSIPQNLLELYFYRLFLAELHTAVSCLSQGGKFVCKLYTAFSASTAALLFLTTRVFEEVQIVKPMTSKATGPERYLVASGFLDNAESSAIQSALARAHAVGGGASPLVTPLLTPLVPEASLRQDHAFYSAMKQMVSALCERQTLALNAVVDRAVFLEDMAMECAVCTDPFSKMTSNHYEEEEEEGRFNERERSRKARVDRLPTPARAGAQKGKGKGKGKGYAQRR